VPKWKYNLKEDGIALRELVNDEKEAEIIEQLQKCYYNLLSQLVPNDKAYYGSAIEEAYSLLDGEAEVIRNNPDEIINEWEFTSIEELINCRLREFYNICDDVRCWVEL